MLFWGDNDVTPTDDIVEVPSLSISASWVGTAVVVVLLVAVEFVGTWLTSNVENVVAVIGAAGIGSVVTLCILTVSVLVIDNAAIVNGSVEIGAFVIGGGIS